MQSEHGQSYELYVWHIYYLFNKQFLHTFLQRQIECRTDARIEILLYETKTTGWVVKSNFLLWLSIIHITLQVGELP